MENKYQLSLIDVVYPQIIRVGVSAKNREDAIRTAGRVLAEAGIVEERYIEAMVQTCDELGPYIVLAPGVAIPHAGPEKGAIAIGISVIVLKEPIEFGNIENDPVRIVMAFASNDSDNHMRILSELALFLGDQERLQALSNACSPDEVIQILAHPVNR